MSSSVMFGPDGVCLVSREELRASVDADRLRLAYTMAAEAEAKKKNKPAPQPAIPTMTEEPEPMSLMDRKVVAYKEWRRRAEGGAIAGGWTTKYLSLIDDYAQVWLPDAKEMHSCCHRIDMRGEDAKRTPHKLFDHCKSYLHVAAVFNLDAAEFSKYARLLEREHKQKEAR